MARFDPRNATDAELLARYEQGRDRCAFAELVRRHGPMVMATTRRLLDNRCDAEDAFQATFFALARAVDGLRRKEAVAAWLHNAARRASSSIRRGLNRQERKIQDAKEATSTGVTTDTNPLDIAANDELTRILDEEIARLPAKFQMVVVLCHLEGLSQEQAGRQLGIAASTVYDRLAKGRQILKSQLVRRGVAMTLSGVTAAAALSTKESAAMVAPLIAETTTKSALFAAGKSATEVGVNSNVIQAANKVISAMTAAKFSIVGLTAVSLLLVGTMVNGLIGTLPSARAELIFEMPSPISDVINDGSFNWKPSVSADNLTLFWSSNRSGSGEFDIWTSSRDSTSAPWGEPSKLSAVNSPASESSPSISSDGLELYFTRGSTALDRESFDIWVSRRSSVDDTWGAPEELSINSSTEDEDPSISADGLELYFDSNRAGSFNIYVSRRDSKSEAFGPPEVVLSSTGYANISSDGLLLFSSLTDDLAVSERLSKNDAFGPAKLIEGINTSDALEYDGVLSADGSTFYFTSSSPDFSQSAIWQSQIVPEPSAECPALVAMASLLVWISRRRNREVTL